MWSRVKPAAAAAIFLAATCGCFLPASASFAATAAPAAQDPAPKGTPGDVLARVNGTPITRAQVDRTIRIFLAQNHTSHEVPEESRAEAQEAALEQLIGSALLYEKGRALEVKDLEAQVAEKLTQAKKKLPSEASYREALEANLLTEKDAEEIVRTEIVVTNLLEREVTGKVAVSEEEMRRFYDDNREKFTAPAGVHLAHILVGVDPGATIEERVKAKEKAATLREKLVAGAEFAALAKAESSCPSKEEGGDLGFFDVKELLPGFDKGTAHLKPGELSQVVETRFGFHVLKLVERREEKVTPFAEARTKIEYYLRQKKEAQAITEYVAALKKGAKIERTPGA